MRVVGVVSILLLACTTTLHAQTAQQWIERGHVAAREDRHAEAIAAYENAIAADAGVRQDLLASLGRQYLWADQPARAAKLLHEYLRYGDECAVRSDYGLALSWSDRLGEAADVFAHVIDECAEEATDARLRLALVRRWQDRPSDAARHYEAVIESADPAAAFAARIGLAHVALQQEYNRDALRMFEELDVGARNESDRRAAREGMTVALARIGEYARAGELLETFGPPLSRDLGSIEALLQSRRRPAAALRVRGFQDRDGTRSTGLVGFADAWIGRGLRAGVEIGYSELSGAADVGLVRGAVRGELRTSAMLGVHGGIGVAYEQVGDWIPVTGELNAVITPNDRLRVDIGAARLLVPDNIAALQNRLTGTFLSVGADVRVSSVVSAVAAADVTRWSTGNERVRLRALPRWQLEGAPRLTLELPVLLQFYDSPLPIALWSPERYVEGGPGAGLYLRVRRHWNLALYARAGVQQETGRSAEPFAASRVALWRDPLLGWSLRLGAAWSSSSLAGAGGFERTALELSASRAF